jgi:stage II sporulation protein D
LIRLLLAAVILPGALCAQITYKVRLTASEGGRLVDLSAEKYVAAVLAGESSTFRSDEALKAMAIAARTYAAYFKSRHAAEGFDFCSTTHCQRVVLKDINARFTKAAADTRGLLLWYEARPAFAVYTRDCGGSSEAARLVWPDIRAPYLPVHDDPYCTRHHPGAWSWSAPVDALKQALLASKLRVPKDLMRVTVLDQTGSGRARSLLLAGRNSSDRISAGSFRLAVGRDLGWNTIRSDRYQVRSSGNRFLFTGNGQGHGVGLCQNGAEEMGLEGFGFRDILQFYYPGTSVSRLATGIAWKRLSSGEAVVFTARPDRDGAILRMAGKEVSELQTRWHIPFRTTPEIYVYPDMDSFRNGTGEPGWVAAYTQGNRIEMQPLDVLSSRGLLQSTLRHELLHVLIESRATPGLPIWFREGLVENLAGDVMRRRATLGAQSAEATHNAAAARVAKLINHYGVGAVLGWVGRGLPPAVLHSSASNTPANSK